jgi:hypothetical protein
MGTNRLQIITHSSITRLLEENEKDDRLFSNPSICKGRSFFMSLLFSLLASTEQKTSRCVCCLRGLLSQVLLNPICAVELCKLRKTVFTSKLRRISLPSRLLCRFAVCHGSLITALIQLWAFNLLQLVQQCLRWHRQNVITRHHENVISLPCVRRKRKAKSCTLHYRWLDFP